MRSADQARANKLPPILVVDDEKNMRHALKAILSDEGYAVTAVESAEIALDLLKDEEFFMVTVDARLGGMSGYEFLTKLRATLPDLPAMMITAYATPKLAVEAIKAGAIDYLPKPFAPEEFLHSVARCAERYRLLQENIKLRSRTGDSVELSQIIGSSPAIRAVRDQIKIVAPSYPNLLITGESGTGKDLVARAIYAQSQRKNGPFLAINCGALPEQLAESELFGHEKGAFTGATRKKRGKVELADGGILFLDEVGELSPSIQVKLLRFLQNRTFSPIGSEEEHVSNVRVIAATIHCCVIACVVCESAHNARRTDPGYPERSAQLVDCE